MRCGKCVKLKKRCKFVSEIEDGCVVDRKWPDEIGKLLRMWRNW